MISFFLLQWRRSAERQQRVDGRIIFICFYFFFFSFSVWILGVKKLLVLFLADTDTEEEEFLLHIYCIPHAINKTDDQIYQNNVTAMFNISVCVLFFIGLFFVLFSYLFHPPIKRICFSKSSPGYSEILQIFHWFTSFSLRSDFPLMRRYPVCSPLKKPPLDVWRMWSWILWTETASKSTIWSKKHPFYYCTLRRCRIKIKLTGQTKLLVLIYYR